MKKLIITLAFFLAALDASHAETSLFTGPLNQIKNQEYKLAASSLYKIVFSSKANEEDKIKARYFFAYALMKLKLNQTAAFPMIISAKTGTPKIAQKSFEHLVNISESLNDTDLLDFTLKQLNANDLSEIAKEVYYNRMGQTLIRTGKYDEAARYLNLSLKTKPDNEEALYTLALAYLKQNKTTEGISSLEKIYSSYSSRPVTSIKRQTAALALARAYYQAKRWDDAIALYREIPKDHPLYRQTQSELSWSLFRAAKFRSAMSAIQTLHTPFYENFYDPESLILRTIILIFVCHPEEAEKSLAAFTQNYSSAYAVLSEISNSSHSPEFFYEQIDEAKKYLKALKSNQPVAYSGRIPLFIVRAMMETPKLKNKIEYIDRINIEKNRLNEIFAGNENTSLRRYAMKILDVRQKSARQAGGNLLRNTLIEKTQELALLTGDVSLLNYEILSTKKNAAHKEYISKINSGQSASIDQDNTRDFYVKNGYRYWPFEGEYWKDEIGNYQYLGVNRCDQEE